MAAVSPPITIKRYSGRRHYNPGRGAYVTLDDLAMMVEDGKDITRSALKQIILERGSHG